MDEDYGKLLRPVRRRDSSRGGLGALQESESDRARLLYSAAFRRLQRKTQVFPLEENAAVRSRLTHSLEVAHVGRFIATSVVEKLDKAHKLAHYKLDSELCLALANLVDTACLAHDIGNPPFGHFGESAIAAWAEKISRSLDDKTSETVSIFRDFHFFDGNPQGLRVITSLAGVDRFGMNLTAAQIAATVKYPCVADDIDGDIPIQKKAGIFASELKTWEWVRSVVGLNEKCRFPIAFLMEAADDISYCLSDIEDGIEKNYTSHDEFYEAVGEVLEENGGDVSFLKDVLKRANDNASHVDPTVYTRTTLVRQLVDEAASAYVSNHASIFAGEVHELLDHRSSAYSLLKAIRDTVKKKLYGQRKSVELELAGCAAISGILAKYEPLIALGDEDFSSLSAAKVRPSLVEAQRLYSLLAPKYVKAYLRDRSQRDHLMDRYSRMQLIIDHVSGMTDVFALQTYQVITGIRSG